VWIERRAQSAGSEIVRQTPDVPDRKSGKTVKETAMNRLWAMGALAMVLSAGNVGCYLDQLQAEQRANRVLQEDLARAKSDLQDEQAMNRQKDTQIDSLSKQLAAKDETVGSLTA